MRYWIYLFATGLMGGLAGCSQDGQEFSGTGTDNRQPNILFIVGDDLGYSDIGAFGSEIPTPNLDELAFQGVRLTNFHADRACQQTRVMMMASSGVSAALESRPAQSSGQRANRLSLDWATLPELLQDAGYETYMTGKWDLGLEPGYTPATRGFDRSFVQLGASASHFAEVLWGDDSMYELNGRRVAYEDLPEDFYSTNYYTDRMLEFIQSNDGDTPWFAYVPYTTPHWPLQVPEEWLDRYAGEYDSGYDELRESRSARAAELGVVPAGASMDDFEPVAAPWSALTAEEQRRHARAQEIYAAMVENLDVNVGRLIDYLEESGELDDTVVVFTSDHGASASEHGQRPRRPGEGGPQIPGFIDNRFDNWGRLNSFVDHGLGFGEAATAPLKGFKGTHSEGGLRAAAFVRYPDAVAQGEVSGTFMTMMDILPTFLEIAGSEHPGASLYKGREVNEILGRSFWPYLTGESSTVHLPTDTAGWVQGDRGALIRGDYKIVSLAAPGMGRTPWRLYDIVADPGERNDLASQQPDLLAELVEEWETSWR